MLKINILIVLLTFTYCIMQWIETGEKKEFLSFGAILYFSLGFYTFRSITGNDDVINIIYIMSGVGAVLLYILFKNQVQTDESRNI